MQTGTCGLPLGRCPREVQGRGTTAAHPQNQGPSHRSSRLWQSRGAHPALHPSQNASGSSRGSLLEVPRPGGGVGSHNTMFKPSVTVGSKRRTGVPRREPVWLMRGFSLQQSRCCKLLSDLQVVTECVIVLHFQCRAPRPTCHTSSTKHGIDCYGVWKCHKVRTFVVLHLDGL